MYFFLFLVISFFYFLHPCGAVFLHPDTILRKCGVHQLLKCLVVVKARKPRLKQSHLCSCHWVGDFKISVTDFVTSLYFILRKSPKHPHQFGSCQRSWPYLFTTLLCPSALHLTSQTVQDPTGALPHLWSLYVLLPSISCTFPCPSGSYIYITSTKKLAVLTQSWLSLLSVPCAIFYICLCIYDSVWRLPVYFSSLHFIFQGGLGHLHLIIPVLVTMRTFAHSY